MAEEYTNSMRSERMGNGKDIKADITTVAPQSKSSEEVSSNEGKAVPMPDFVDAGNFLRGGGKVDGEMENIGSITSVPKGTPAPGAPSLEKGVPGPQGPGVI